jgi:hypothetical protein
VCSGRTCWWRNRFTKSIRLERESFDPQNYRPAASTKTFQEASAVRPRLVIKVLISAFKNEPTTSRCKNFGDSRWKGGWYLPIFAILSINTKKSKTLRKELFGWRFKCSFRHSKEKRILAHNAFSLVKEQDWRDDGHYGQCHCALFFKDVGYFSKY